MKPSNTPMAPVELTDLELDSVSGGALVDADVRLNNIRTNILNDSLNNNDVAVNAAVLAVQRNINRQA